jgi:hypothetical protein
MFVPDIPICEEQNKGKKEKRDQLARLVLFKLCAQSMYLTSCVRHAKFACIFQVTGLGQVVILPLFVTKDAG